MATEREDYAQVTVTLQDSEETRALWPHRFLLELSATVRGSQLEVDLRVQNTDSAPWPFTAALHTYLAISDLAGVRLQGLGGCRCLDTVVDREGTEGSSDMGFVGEIDRIYRNAPALVLRDGSRRLDLHAEGLPDAVVWNPGPQKCATLSDMEEDGWKRMLCVEAAAIMEPVMLDPGLTWRGVQRIHSSGSAGARWPLNGPST